MSNKLSIVQAATAAVSTDVRGFLAHGTLQLPSDYSVENALKSAEITLPTVKNLQNCTEASIKYAIRSMCVQGLNPDKKQCYFIAYGESLTLQRSYMGEIAVAKRVDPNIEDIFPAVVFEGDKFEYDIKRGKIVEIRHSQKPENKNNPIKYAYATVVYKDGSEVSTTMTFEQIKQAWKQSPSSPINSDGTVKPESTHGKFPEAMALKTVVRRACKPIIDSSSDASLFGQYARQCADDADAAEVDAEVSENANREMIDADFKEVPEGVNPEAGEYTEPEAPQEGAEPF